VLAERPAVPVEEQPADGVQALGRQIAPVVGAMAVGPLVVTGRVDERVLERLEVGEPCSEVGGVAACGTVLDVAEVHDSANARIRVDLGDVGGELGDQRVAVGDVPDDGDRRGGAR
jgi:hypothetical protein